MHQEAERGRLQRELFAARVLPVLECAAIAWMLALLTSRLFGGPAGLFAGLLWLVDPFVIGIGHLDGIDVPATFTTVLLALAVLQARSRPTGRHMVLVGVGAGLAILARLTGLLLLDTLKPMRTGHERLAWAGPQ